MKPGFKQTEIGAIPEDWSVSPLGHNLRRPPAYGINAPATLYDSDHPTYLRITDITEDCRYSEASKVSVKHPQANSYLLEQGDIVFARTGASVGKSYLYRPSDGPLVFAGFLIRLSPNKSTLIPGFLAYYAQSRTYNTWVQLNSTRTGQPGINGREYGTLPVPLPPTLAEQEAIASALGDADALIESLERLVAKKRDLKQGAMQELLTARRRLPGFTGKWETTRFGQLGRCIRGVGYNPDIDLSPCDMPSSIRLLRANNVQDASIVFSDFQYVNARRVSSEQRLKPKDVLICMANGSKELVGKAGQFAGGQGYDYTFGAFMGCFRPDVSAADPDFSFFMFQTEAYRKHIAVLLAGTSINNLNPGNVENFEMPMPRDRSEQTAIAAVLSDMDAEIAALEAKLAKARAIKQGMMQELLTGRIRLK